MRLRSAAEMEGSIVKAEPGAEFLPAQRFGGSRAGYVFKRGGQGVGYYIDTAAPAPGTGGGYAASPAAAQAARTAEGRSAGGGMGDSKAKVSGWMEKTQSGGMKIKVEVPGGGGGASSGQSAVACCVCVLCVCCVGGCGWVWVGGQLEAYAP